MSAFGDELEKYMTKHSLDIQFVAEKVGVSRKTVMRWMLGDWNPHPVMIPVIWEILTEYP